MCQFRMMSHVETKKDGSMGFVQRPTGFMTSSPCIAMALSRKCPGDHQHVQLLGGRAKMAAQYPVELCEAICRGVVQQKQADFGKSVGTGKMSSLQLSAFCQGVHAGIRRERALQGLGSCSSVCRDGHVSRPVGDWPSDWVEYVHE